MIFVLIFAISGEGHIIYITMDWFCHTIGHFGVYDDNESCVSTLIT